MARNLKLAILVTGMPGSGKSIVSEAARMIGVPVYIMGNFVREEAVKRGLDLSSDVLGKLAIELRGEKGKHIVAKLVMDKLKERNDEVVLIEGVRNIEELKYFLTEIGKIILVAVHASPKTRFERLYKRGRSDDPKNWEEFKERDYRELNMGIGSVIALADIMLVNENITKEEFLKISLKTLKRVLENEGLDKG